MMDAHVLCNFSSADCPILVQTVALPNVIALCCHFQINDWKTAPLMSVRAHYIYWCALVSSDRPSALFKWPIMCYHSQLKNIIFSHANGNACFWSFGIMAQTLSTQSVHFHCLLFTRHHASSSVIGQRRELKRKNLFHMAAAAFYPSR